MGLFLVIRTGVVQAFYIPSSSMEDTLLVGDYLLANKFIYGVPVDVPLTSISLFRLPALKEPQPGDIVIFRSPQDEGRDSDQALRRRRGAARGDCQQGALCRWRAGAGPAADQVRRPPTFPSRAQLPRQFWPLYRARKTISL